MIAAAKYAVEHGEVVCSPTSGFHHAHYDNAGAFCSFNGILVAAVVLKQMGLVKRVSIIDLDRHYADGSFDIINHLGLDWVDHFSQGQFFNSRADCAGGKFTQWSMKAINASQSAHLALVQLGADPHLFRPAGGLAKHEIWRHAIG